MLQSQERRELPFHDILSWTFGDVSYSADKPIYVDAHDPSQRVNRQTTEDFVRRIIAGLKAHGFQPGDRLCFHSMNNIWHNIITLGTIGAGGCYVASNPAYSSHELQHILSVSKANFLIVEPHLLPNILPACEKAGLSQSNIFLFENPFAERNGRSSNPLSDQFPSFVDLISHGPGSWRPFIDENLAKGTPAILLWTSGTTGLPKAAVLSHFSMVSESIMTHDPRTPYEPIRLIPILLSHSYAVDFTLVTPIRYGITNYIMQKYTPNLFPAFIAKYRVTETIVAPPIVASLLSLPRTQTREQLAPLRSVFCGGAPLSVAIKTAFEAEVLSPEACVSMCWGMTECLWLTRFYYPERDNSGSVGRLIPNKEIRIIGSSGADLAPGTAGEILVRSPSMFSGYLDNPLATSLAFLPATTTDGALWLRTGDIGSMLPDGRLYISGREKDIIKVRGWQVSPAELEDVVRAVPGVLDVAVVGFRPLAADKDGGEVPRAYVVLATNGELLLDKTAVEAQQKRVEEEIHAGVAAKLASWKRLVGGVRFVKLIPRGPSGKILRHLVREMADTEGKGVVPEVVGGAVAGGS